MKKKISCIIYMTLLHLTIFAQNGHYMPGGVDLHAPGNNPWQDRPWTLVFSDEFNYSGPPDPNKWENRNEGADAVGNGAMSTYRQHNVVVNNGICEIKIRKENAIENTNGVPKLYSFTSGEIRTVFSDNWTGHFFKEGMFEAEIQMPEAFWSHSNFWLLGGNTKTDGTGEIDIAECRGSIGNRVINGMRFVPQRVHHYDDACAENVTTQETGSNIKISSRADKGFHIYTCIWDKHYVYFFIDHQYVQKVERWQFSPINVNNSKVDFDLIANNFQTSGGYYWTRNYALPINMKANLSLHTFLDPKNKNGAMQRLTKQGAGVETSMKIKWVRVYMRADCSEDEEVTNSNLLPYETTDRFYKRVFDPVSNNYVESTEHHNQRAQHLTMGTKNSFTQWQNIAAPWAMAMYKAETITLLPNYICYPEWVEAEPCPEKQNQWTYKLSSTIFLANPCEQILSGQEGGDNEYIEVTIPEHDTTSLDTFDCNDIDTAWVNYTIDSLLSAGDTVSADSIISFIVDSLGCEYWGYGGGGGSKPGRGSDGSPVIQYRTVKNQIFVDRIRIYPNPTTGSFHIEMPQRGNYSLRVVNILGSTVYDGKMTDEQRKSILLDNNLPPGNYTLHISGDGLRHVERITLTK